jgi:hypothetical protein
MAYEDLRLAPRYSFIADIEVTEVLSEIQIRGRTNNLSLFGCGVNNIEALSEGTEGQD